MKDSCLSPLRYPGGKASLAGFLRNVIDLNGLDGCTYYEPYAGGAGAALALLLNGHVSKLVLNDADVRIFAFWWSILNKSQAFIERVLETPVDMQEWRRQREIFKHPGRYSRFDIGFSAFFMNRCNRSGVLTGGPIGGYSQAGDWKLDVRFGRQELADRIRRIAFYRKQIDFCNMDAIEFLKTQTAAGTKRKASLVYLDPPYVGNGHRLYLNYYGEKDHRRLAAYMKRQKTLPWIMSYDDSQVIRELYAELSIGEMPLRYVLNNKRDACELIIAASVVALPSGYRYGRDYRFLRKIA